MTPEQLADYLDMKHIGQHKAAAELRRLAVENEALRAESMRFRDDALNEQAARRAIEAALAERQGEAVPSAQITAELGCVLSDPDTKLSAGAKRALQWVLTWTSVPLYTHPAPAQQPLSEEQDREAFESWAGPITALAKENGGYVEGMTSLAWEAWQARAAHGIGGEKPEPPHGWSAERYAKYQADVRDAGDKP